MSFPITKCPRCHLWPIDGHKPSCPYYLGHPPNDPEQDAEHSPELINAIVSVLRDPILEPDQEVWTYHGYLSAIAAKILDVIELNREPPS